LREVSMNKREPMVPMKFTPGGEPSRGIRLKALIALKKMRWVR